NAITGLAIVGAPGDAATKSGSTSSVLCPPPPPPPPVETPFELAAELPLMDVGALSLSPPQLAAATAKAASVTMRLVSRPVIRSRSPGERAGGGTFVCGGPGSGG